MPDSLSHPTPSDRMGGSGLLNGEVKQAFRSYVTAHDESRHQFQGDGLIRMDIRHNLLEQRWHDLRFDLDSSIFQVKEKLHKHGAGAVASMELFLRRSGIEDTVFLYDDMMTLRQFGAGNDMQLFVKDTDPYSMARGGGLEDVSQVEKYNMVDEDYDKREKTLRRHIKEETAKDPNFVMFKNQNNGEAERPKTPENVKDLYPLDARCETNPGGRRGTIKFVGEVKKAKGTFIGIALDEPQGFNDGGKEEVKYFDCKGDKYGCFSRPENVVVGDFPELDPFEGLDDEDEI